MGAGIVCLDPGQARLAADGTMEMQYRRLGRTGLEVSRLSLGTGGPNRMGQKRGADRDDMIALVHGALDLGVNLFDTSPRYMESEVVLGEALRAVHRDRYLVTTKFHPGYEGPIPDAAELAESVESSLRRLATDHIDVLFLHSVTPDRYEAALDQLMPEMERFRDKGLIRHLGMTESPVFDATHVSLSRAVADGRFDVVMVVYNLLNQTAADELLPAAAAAEVGVVGMIAVGRQLSSHEQVDALLQDWADRGLVDSPEDGLRWLISGDVRSLADAAYRFAAAPPEMTTVLTGTANLSHLHDNIASILGPALAESHVDRLRELFFGVAEPVAR